MFGACKFSQIVSPQARRSSSPTWTRRIGPTALRMSSPTYRSSTDWAKRWDRAKAWRTNAALAAGRCDVVDTPCILGTLQAVVKAMELLALEGKIKEKIYGKQKIYFADQVQFFFFFKCYLHPANMLLTSIWCVRCKWQLLTSPSGSVWRCEGLRAAGHGPSDLRAWCRGTDPHPELQTAGCRWAKRVPPGQVCIVKKKKNCSKVLFICTVLGKSFGCMFVCETSVFRAEGAQQLADYRRNDVRDPGTENRVRWAQSASGEDQVCHESRHPGGEGEGRGFTCVGKISDTLLTRCRWVLSCHFNTQVYREREVYVKEWRKRKRLVMLRGH